MEELKQLSVLELKELAKMKDIKLSSKMTKSEIIEAILRVTPKMTGNTEESGNIIKNSVAEAEVVPNNKDDFLVEGVLEVLPDGYGFLRGENYLSTPKDVYVSPVQIRRFKLDTGDKLKGIGRAPREGEKFPALIYVNTVNGDSPDVAIKRVDFDDLTPIFPNRRIKLETKSNDYAMR